MHVQSIFPTNSFPTTFKAKHYWASRSVWYWYLNIKLSKIWEKILRNKIKKSTSTRFHIIVWHTYLVRLLFTWQGGLKLTSLHKPSPDKPCPTLPSAIPNFDIAQPKASPALPNPALSITWKLFWQYFGSNLTLLWHYFVITLTLLWHCYGITFALLWHYFDITLVLLWQYFCITSTLLFQYFGLTLSLLWPYFNITLALLLHYFGLNLTLLLHYFGINFYITLLYFCKTLALLSYYFDITLA